MEKDKQEAEVLHEVFNLINDWMKNADSPDLKVIDYQKPSDLEKILNLNIGDQTNLNSVLDEVRNYLKYAVKTNHPGYVNQLFGGFNFPAFIGEVITSLTNTSMYTYEVAPVATLMERKIIDKMLSYTGWETGNGALMTGGSNTNMVAMLLARNSIYPEAKSQGLSALPKLAIYVSERSHFSMLKGANAIGIGHDGVFKVQIDENGRMRGDGLKSSIQQSIAEGFTPMMVCATAGTTEMGSFDALDEIADIASDYNLWHHVDGSWGASTILSPKRRLLFNGLERADSFSWNPHKLMSIPLVCSALLVKNEDVMHEAIGTSSGDYIYHDNEHSAYDFGPDSLQCGRRVDALKLWLSWKFHGDDGYAERIEHVFDLAQFATEIVEKSDALELCFPTQSLNVNFRFVVPNGVDADSFNEKLRYRLLQKGKLMVNFCRINDAISIRLVLLNPELTRVDVTRIFERFVSEGKAMLAEIPVLKSH